MTQPDPIPEPAEPRKRLESAFPDAYEAAIYLRNRAFHVRKLISLLRQAREADRATDFIELANPGWADAVDVVLKETADVPA